MQRNIVFSPEWNARGLGYLDRENPKVTGAGADEVAIAACIDEGRLKWALRIKYRTPPWKDENAVVHLGSLKELIVNLSFTESVQGETGSIGFKPIPKEETDALMAATEEVEYVYVDVQGANAGKNYIVQPPKNTVTGVVFDGMDRLKDEAPQLWA